LSHAQIIDSTYILAVDRRVQEIDAAKDYEIRTLENEEFLAQMRQGLNPTCVPRAAGYRRSP